MTLIHRPVRAVPTAVAKAQAPRVKEGKEARRVRVAAVAKAKPAR